MWSVCATEGEAVLAKARRNLDRLKRVHGNGRSNPWLTEWQLVLDRGPEAVMRVLTSEGPDAAELRQNSPFAGVLTDIERRSVLDAFRKDRTA